MENIKELLGEELFTQVKEKLGDKELIVNDGTYIPRTRLNEEKEKLKELKSQYDELSQKVSDLDKLSKDNEELKKSLEEINQMTEQQKAEYENRIAAMKKETMLEKELAKYEAKNPVVVKNLLDLERIKMDGDTLIGVKDQIEKLKESDPYLFGKEKEPPNPGNGKPNSNQTVNPFKPGEHFSLAEQIKIKRENPDLAARLKQEALGA